ncbi:MAG: DUF1624 domain-containing protein [Alphaproteobacteria bacterium]|nr:MAG: DUF1624 domain-containing protein [Alphaproteobacteria bacterium]
MSEPATPARAWRLNSIDFLRGLVMVIMALDHVRDYFTDARFDPLDLSQTDGALFFTRWITHFCAPIFVLLAGMSAGLMAARRSTAELSRFLFTRGIWLLFIEMTVVSVGWTFSIFEGFLFVMQVIWAIGASMLVMAVLVWLPKPAILAFGLILIFGHNILDNPALFPVQDWSRPMPVWHVLHNGGMVMLGSTPMMLAYPIIPWVAIMPIGYVLADLYSKDAALRQRILMRLGLGAIILFAVLRSVNIYGEPASWALQDTALKSLMSFVNLQKYPPSLQYLLVMLGGGLIVLSLAEKWRGRFVDWMVTFGRVPFFYYILHIYLIHAFGLLAAELQGFGWRSLATMFFGFPQGYGFNLWVVYGVWVATIVILYPPSKWFAGVKARRKDWWLSYL